VALLIIVLLSGSQLHVNPNAVAALVTAREADDTAKRYTDEVRCVVQMVNGKEYTTREECSSIELRINEMKP
jgi:hypothetical protein